MVKYSQYSGTTPGSMEPSLEEMLPQWSCTTLSLAMGSSLSGKVRQEKENLFSHSIFKYIILLRWKLAIF